MELRDSNVIGYIAAEHAELLRCLLDPLLLHEPACVRLTKGEFDADDGVCHRIAWPDPVQRFVDPTFAEGPPFFVLATDRVSAQHNAVWYFVHVRERASALCQADGRIWHAVPFEDSGQGGDDLFGDRFRWFSEVQIQEA